MKIIFFVRRFYPLIGGVEKHCFEIGKRLIKGGHNITIITETENISEKKYEEYCGFKIYRILVSGNEKNKKFIIWTWLIKNISLIKNCDIIHCHDVFYWFLPFKLVFHRKKVYVTFHGYEGNEPPTLGKILQHKIAERLSTGNICIGGFHNKWYKVKPTIISFGAANIVENKKTIIKYDFCFVGRLSKDTGIDIYLKTMKRLYNYGFKKNIVVCGDGPLMEESMNFCKENKINSHFMGFVKNVDKYLSESKYVFVSRYLGIIETFLHKKLVYAVFDNDIKKDYLKISPFSNWIIMEKDPVKLAEKIIKNFKSDKMTKAKIISSYNWAKKQTWEEMVKKYLQLWKIPSL